MRPRTAHGRVRIYRVFAISVMAFYLVVPVGALVELISWLVGADGGDAAGHSVDGSWIWPGLFTAWYAVAAVLTVWLSRLRVDGWQVDPKQTEALVLVVMLTATTFFAFGTSIGMPWRVLPPAVAVGALAVALVLRWCFPLPMPSTARPRMHLSVSPGAGKHGSVSSGGKVLGGVFPDPDTDVWLGAPVDTEAQAWADHVVPGLVHRVDDLGGGMDARARLRTDDPEAYLRAALLRAVQVRAGADTFVRLPQREVVDPEMSCIAVVRYRIDGPGGALVAEVAGADHGHVAGEPEVSGVGPWQRTVQQVVEADGSPGLSARYTRRAALAPGHEVDVLVDGSAPWSQRDAVLGDLDALALSVRIVNAAGGTA